MPSCLDPACCTRSCLDLTLQSDACHGCLKIGKGRWQQWSLTWASGPWAEVLFCICRYFVHRTAQPSPAAWMRKLLLWPQRMRPNNLVASPVQWSSLDSNVRLVRTSLKRFYRGCASVKIRRSRSGLTVSLFLL